MKDSDKDLLAEARELGEIVAWTHNKEMNTGCTGTAEAARINDALDRLEAIVDVLGPAAMEAYANGYDEVIDFSLNTAWRENLDKA